MGKGGEKGTLGDSALVVGGIDAPSTISNTKQNGRTYITGEK